MFLSRIARLLLRLGGWTLIGEAPTVAKAIIIAAPHTSNWDGYWALVLRAALQLDVRFFAKQSLFWFPLNLLLRGLGGIPLDRERAGSAVRQAVEMFDANEQFYFALAPEGTRAKTPCWKTGFYRIAESADVPVVLGFFDYANKRLGLGPTLVLTGDRDSDLAICRDFYQGFTGRWPEKTSPIVFDTRKSGQRERRIR